jgi:hypothetical protein
MRKLSRAEQIPHVLKQYKVVLKICVGRKSAHDMKNIVEFYEIFTQKGLYLLSHTKSVGAIDIFRCSLFRALK